MELLNHYLSGVLLPAFLMLTGVFFAFKLKFFYILHPVKTSVDMVRGQKKGFSSLSLALAGTLGIGNIVGVASAILMGGAGSIFWMWISAFCAMSLKYAEVFLAIKFQQHGEQNKPYGGAPYYIKYGLEKKLGKGLTLVLASIFAILCVVNSLTTGNLVQINSVSSLLPVSSLFFGIVFTVLVFAVICGGYLRICKITAFLIPILSSIYIFLCLVIILGNIYEIPRLFEKIFSDAFGVRSASAGFCGYGIAASIRYGVSRGVLSNEAGCGTSPAAHASSKCESPHRQACLGIFEVFFDTVVLCSLTAFIILLAGSKAESPMELVLFSFEKYTGAFGTFLVALLSILFAFATVVCQYFYGIEALRYFSNKRGKTAYTFIFCLILLLGAVMPMSLMWQISDLAIAVMTVINLGCLLLLSKHIK